jgi:nitrate/TMAO reductase-like tetraheme cytochrome c subunit
MSSFNHDNTNFKLENMHKNVDCKECHKTKFTDHLSHNRCTDCHDDYHNGQFTKQEITQDCADCHSTKGFSATSFTIERHNESDFHLEGAHLATPWFVCHKKEESWEFRNIGINCVDCHDDIHSALIDKKYYPDADCKSCHTVNQWAEIRFDHSKTDYELLGEHKKQTCRACHFKSSENGIHTQKFSGLTPACTECHTDKHFNQFEVNGATDCLKCHDYNNWKAEKFDHNTTRFPLDGKHKNVSCAGCHKEKSNTTATFIQYKLNEFRCENCH